MKRKLTTTKNSKKRATTTTTAQRSKGKASKMMTADLAKVAGGGATGRHEYGWGPMVQQFKDTDWKKGLLGFAQMVTSVPTGIVGAAVKVGTGVAQGIQQDTKRGANPPGSHGRR
jgi:hypothetical protein